MRQLLAHLLQGSQDLRHAAHRHVRFIEGRIPAPLLIAEPRQGLPSQLLSLLLLEFELL